jgi:hypothetical protein
VPTVLPFTSKVTVPAGVPAPGPTAVTVADSRALVTAAVVVVAAFPTTMLICWVLA